MQSGERDRARFRRRANPREHGSRGRSIRSGDGDGDCSRRRPDPRSALRGAPAGRRRRRRFGRRSPSPNPPAPALDASTAWAACGPLAVTTTCRRNVPRGRSRRSGWWRPRAHRRALGHRTSTSKLRASSTGGRRAGHAHPTALRTASPPARRRGARSGGCVPPRLRLDGLQPPRRRNLLQLRAFIFRAPRARRPPRPGSPSASPRGRGDGSLHQRSVAESTWSQWPRASRWRIQR